MERIITIIYSFFRTSYIRFFGFYFFIIGFNCFIDLFVCSSRKIKIRDNDFFFIGHRGTRTDLDENTLLAFNKSLEFGANYIEFDVRKTKDEQLVILHDPTLDRTTIGKGNLRRFTYKELKNFKTIIDYTYIPLLSEVLKKLKGKIKFIIEVKDEKISNKIVRIIKDLGVFFEIQS